MAIDRKAVSESALGTKKDYINRLSKMRRNVYYDGHLIDRTDELQMNTINTIGSTYDFALDPKFKDLATAKSQSPVHPHDEREGGRGRDRNGRAAHQLELVGKHDRRNHRVDSKRHLRQRLGRSLRLPRRAAQRLEQQHRRRELFRHQRRRNRLVVELRRRYLPG